MRDAARRKKAKDAKTFHGAENLGRYYQLGRKFITLSDEVQDHAAYQALSPTEVVILLDVLRTIRDKYAMTPMPKAGTTPFTYTYGECRVRVSENTFHKAMKRLVEVGWLEVRPEHQRAVIAGPTRYALSDRWKTYKPSDEEARAQRAKDQRKVNRVEQAYERRQNLFSQAAASSHSA